jgi:hypothetical protein
MIVSGWPVTLPVFGDGDFAGTIRRGSVGHVPIHAAACAKCWAVVYYQPTFEETALWFPDHLASAHGIRIVSVEIERLPDSHVHRWDRRAVEVVEQLGAAWGGHRAPSIGGRVASRSAGGMTNAFTSHHNGKDDES